MAASTNLTTTADVKQYLGLNIACSSNCETSCQSGCEASCESGVETDYDSLIAGLIARASEAIENYCHRRFASTEHTEYHDGWGESALVLDHRPITAVSTVHDDLNRDFESETLIESDDYAFYPDAGILELLEGAFQKGIRNVKVVYTAGYATVPTDVTQAACILVASWFNRGKQGGDGIARETLGQYTAEYAGEPLPSEVRQLLEHYRNVQL